MSRIWNALVTKVTSFIPPAGSLDRQILFLLPLLHFQPGQDRGRYGTTIASLGVQNRFSEIDNPFIDWMKRGVGPELLKNPVIPLMYSQLYDLVCKVIVSTAFYITSQVSLYAALTTLLSQSQRVSKVAQPYLDGIASLPIPRPLKAVRVIVFAPIIIKLIHMALIYADPKGENRPLNILKKTADKTGQALECLFNLRLTLISLGLSKNLLGCVVSTLFFKAVGSKPVKDLVSNPELQMILDQSLNLVAFFTPPYGQEHKGLTYIHSILGGTDISMWPRMGFQAGINALWASFFASSDACDVESLETLFNKIEQLTKEDLALSDQQKYDIKLRDEIDQAKREKKFDADLAKKQYALYSPKVIGLFKSIPSDQPFTQLRQEIEQAEKEGKIDANLKNKLQNHLRTKIIDLCLLNPDLKTDLEVEGVCEFLKGFFCPNQNDGSTAAFFGLLVKLSKLEFKAGDLEKARADILDLLMPTLVSRRVISETDFKEFGKFIEEKLEPVIDELFQKKDRPSILSFGSLMDICFKHSMFAEEKEHQIKSSLINFFLLNPDFETDLQIEGVREFLKSFFCPNHDDGSTAAFLGLLVKLSKLEFKADALEKARADILDLDMPALVSTNVISETNFKEFSKFIGEKLEPVLEKESINNLFQQKDLRSILSLASLMNTCLGHSMFAEEKVNQIRSSCFQEICELFPRDFDLSILQDLEQEKVFDLLSSILFNFAKTPDEEHQAHLVFARFQAHRFPVILKWYQENAPQNVTARKKCEQLLRKLHPQAFFPPPPTVDMLLQDGEKHNREAEIYRILNALPKIPDDFSPAEAGPYTRHAPFVLASEIRFLVKLSNAGSLKETYEAFENLDKLKLLVKGLISENDFNELNNFILEKADQVFTDKMMDEILDRADESLIYAFWVLSACLNFSSNNQQKVDPIKLKFYEKMRARLPEAWDESIAQDPNLEERILILSEKLQYLATTPQKIQEAKFTITRFNKERLRLNVNWYLQNQPQDRDDRKNCEAQLFKLAQSFLPVVFVDLPDNFSFEHSGLAGIIKDFGEGLEFVSSQDIRGAAQPLH